MVFLRNKTCNETILSIYFYNTYENYLSQKYNKIHMLRIQKLQEDVLVSFHFKKSFNKNFINLHLSFNMIFFQDFFFNFKKHKVTKRVEERVDEWERFSICCFTPQMAPIARPRSGTWNSIWVGGRIPTTGLIFCCFRRPLAGS